MASASPNWSMRSTRSARFRCRSAWPICASNGVRRTRALTTSISPASRWVAMPDYNQYLSADYWRDHQLELAYGIAAFVLFFAFLFATFPYSLALQGALAPIGLRVESSGQAFALPF